MRLVIQTRIGWTLLALLATACEQDVTSPSTRPLDSSLGASVAGASSAVDHSVTGSGSVSIEGIYFRTSIAAHSDAGGRAWGSLQAPIDLQSIGLGRLTFGGQVTCLDVEGSSAWIGAEVDHSTNGDVLPPGLMAIALVRDLGGNGEDIMHAELYEPGVLCTDRPADLADTVVDRGNFVVR